jgi:protoheme IX farnesyltransferase
VLVIGLVAAAFGRFPSRHPARRWATLALTCTIAEALVGAALVLAGLVASDASVARAAVMSAHLIMTFLLLGALALTAWSADLRGRLEIRGQGAFAWGAWLAFAGVAAVAATGAIAALGDTLFPARTLAEGLAQDLSPSAHFLVRLRVLHPLSAAAVSLYLILLAYLVPRLRPVPGVGRAARRVAVLTCAQLLVGAANVLLLAPVWLQLVHLVVADALWISLVVATAEMFSAGVLRSGLETVEPRPSAGPRATWRDYVALTKPRVISLLLLTTLTAMFAAARGWPGLVLVVAVSLGGAMSAGAANAINMVIDRTSTVRCAVPRAARPSPTRSDRRRPWRSRSFSRRRRSPCSGPSRTCSRRRSRSAGLSSTSSCTRSCSSGAPGPTS